MLNYLNRIALKDNNKRREVLTLILRELNCPYWVQCEKLNGKWIENIIVSFNKGFPRLVIGAHYDTVNNSTGANDNGSSVCILIEVIKRYMNNPPAIPMDIVFFDLEEEGTLGSKSYINHISPNGIISMINLDICGVGDNIVIAPVKNLENSLLGKAIYSVEKLGRHKTRIIEKLPSGDDRRFEEAGISNISVCVLNENDVKCMIDMFLNKEEKPENFPSIIETMHNGSRDSIECIEENAMKNVLNWTLDVVEHFEENN